MSSAERFRPITRLRNSAASAGVKRKSAARSSVNWPRTRKPGQRECGILSGGDDQVQLRRQMIDQKSERLIDRFGIKCMVIIQHQHHPIGDHGDFVQQSGQQRFAGRWLRRLERGQHACADLRRNRLQGCDEVH